MKVNEKPPEIKDELDESDPLNSLFNKLDEDEYQGQVRINERIRQAEIKPLRRPLIPVKSTVQCSRYSF